MIYTNTTQNKFRKYNVNLTVGYKDIIGKHNKTPLRTYHIPALLYKGAWTYTHYYVTQYKYRAY